MPLRTTDIVNIAEKAAGFTIAGNTGSVSDVNVAVVVGTETLDATSVDVSGTGTWSVSVPANAAYIAGTSVAVSVTATKNGYTDAPTVARTLGVDLSAPTAPSYTAPTSLKVDGAITAINPIGAADVSKYEAADLPSGLTIDDTTGVISGTPDTASTTQSTATVTVADSAENTATVTIVFPSVAKGAQVLSGFAYSSASVTYGSTAPTVTPPSGAVGALSYAAEPATVCTVDAGTGVLTLVGAGNCVVTVTAAATANHEQAIVTFAVTVTTAGALALTLDTIADDDIVNIAEYDAGFTISGTTGSDAGVSVAVTLGSEILRASSADENGKATWKVNVPADAAYISGTSVAVNVTATKTGYTDAPAVTQTLAVDLIAPTAPSYTAPTTMTVDETVTAMSPSGGADVGSYEAANLPSGLAIDTNSGVISGTPDTASTTELTATVTVTDTAGNTDSVDVTFPAVGKGEQSLSGFEYSSATVTFGGQAPTVTLPTGAVGTLSYTTDAATVCTVDGGTGVLTIVGAGTCVITATAAATANYNEASVTFEVTVTAAGALALNLNTIATDNTVNIATKRAGFTITGDTGNESDVNVTVGIGTENLTTTSSDDSGTATWSVEVPADAIYITDPSVEVVVNATKTGYTAPEEQTVTLTVDLTAPTAPSYTPPATLTVGVALATLNPSGGADISAYRVAGLPTGLTMNPTSGEISGTPTTADVNTSAATVTVTDSAANTSTTTIVFPPVAKGEQTLSGFAYSSATVAYGANAPTVTAPTGARGALSYTTDAATVCTVDGSTGVLTIIGAGMCVVTATAALTANYDEASVTFTVTVTAAGELALNLNPIAENNIVNIDEKASGFTVSGDTGSEPGVSVTVAIGGSILTATSADDSGTAAWSVSVPGAAAYITEPSVVIVVNATKTGYTPAIEETVTLTVDLTAPTAPSYTAPVSLTVDEAITAMTPSGVSGIAQYEAVNLPSGLDIDPATGVISGTPDTAASAATSTVTVADAAGNTATVAIAFPPVAKGEQTLSGFAYSSATVAYGANAPTVTTPTGAQGALSYTTDVATVCTVDGSTGALTIAGAGTCVVTATAAATANYNEASVTFEVTVTAAGVLALNLNPIATDNTVNIAEKERGFTITGNTGSEPDVSVTVAIGTATLTTLSDDSGTATWAVNVPADAAYITGSSVAVTVSATKSGFTAAPNVVRTLGVDLTAPTAPSYTVPASLTVGEAITAMNPSGGADITGYTATGLPSGLAFNDSTGVISGTPDTASTTQTTVTITVADSASNTATATIAFPPVAKGEQTLSGFAYSSATVTFGSTAPTVTPPTGGVGALSYAAEPATVCTVDAGTGVLTLIGAGDCVVTATAAATENYNAADVTFEVTVTAAGALVLNLNPIATDNTVNITEKGAGFTISGNTGSEPDVSVTVTIGTEILRATSVDTAPATWSVDVPADASYITDPSVEVVVNATKTGYTSANERTITLTVDLSAPTAPSYTLPASLKVGEELSGVDPVDGTDIDSYEASGLPDGLTIDGADGTIGGTPTTADVNTSAATVTVTDSAGNKGTIVLTIPPVAKGDQTLLGFEYSASSVTFGDSAPTLTPPTGAQTTLSYTASPATVCTVNSVDGTLSIVGIGSCEITVTAPSNTNYNAGTATFTVTVQAEGTLVLNIDSITGDDIINIDEKAKGFSISGNTGSEDGVTVAVSIGETELTATSADADPATWSVSVPANASYVTDPSVEVTVSATKTGHASADVRTVALTVDLSAPTAPTYTAPASLKVGEVLSAVDPVDGTDIVSYEASGLPDGLIIDAVDGTISGTPTTADANPASVSITVADAAGNTDSVDVPFPPVTKGNQALSGFEYSASSVTFGDSAPTLTAPTGAQGALSYTTEEATVCTVDGTTGALTIVGAGTCVVTATAAATADYEEATATYSITVQALGTLVLSLDTIADDDTINIAEKAAGFEITGNTGSEPGVSVIVAIGTATLNATSADNSGTAAWSVSVPGAAAYITDPSVEVVVNATKTGHTSAAEESVTLTVDLTPPTAPTYTVPASLKVGEELSGVDPVDSTDIDSYEASGLPDGLTIDAVDGTIGGTPTSADASVSTITVTVADIAGNTNTFDLTFPPVAKGDQTLTDFEYSPSSVTFGDSAPTLTAPTGAQTNLSYTASPDTVCTVNSADGVLTLVGAGSCEITATAEGTSDYNEATATYTVTVQALGTLVLNLDTITDDDTINITEKEEGFSISGDTGSKDDVAVTVSFGETELTATSADTDPAIWSVAVPADASYITDPSVEVVVNATKTGYTSAEEETFTLIVDLTAPTAPTYTLPASLKVGEELTGVDPVDGTDIDGYEASGIPAGLTIDAVDGTIGGTPTTADANASSATVTVTDGAGNTDTIDLTFPPVAKGDQTLAGFEYSASSVTFGDPAPTLTPPTGAQTALSYTASPEEVCTVDLSSGALTIVEAGSCEITATAGETSDYNEATALFTITVQSLGTLVLNLDAITEDGTINVAEKASGFSISGDTGSKDDVAVTVSIGETELTATSADADPATWSVAVPADASYITEPSVEVVVNATKIGYTSAEEEIVTLTVDLTPPTPPTYTVPESLKVGEELSGVDPVDSTDIDSYEASGLPDGLTIDVADGTISGTPTTADASASTITVTVADSAGNTVTTDLTFPPVAKGDQTLTDFEYSPSSVTFGDTAPTLTAPTGVQTTLGYTASPEEICTVDPSSGALTILGVGSCEITVTAVESDNFNEASATFTVTVQALGTLVLNVDTIAGDDTINIDEKANGFSIAGNTGSEDGVTVSVTIGETVITTTSSGDDGTTQWTVAIPGNASYITEPDVEVVVNATKTGFTSAAETTVALIVDLTAPTAPSYTAPASLKVGEELSAVQPTGGSDIDAYSASGLPDGLTIQVNTGVISGVPTTVSTSDSIVTVTVADAAGNTATVDVTFPAVADIDRGVTITPKELTIPEGESASYTVVLISQPTGTVTITPTVSGSTDVSVDTSALNFTPDDWDDLQTVTVRTVHDVLAGDDVATVSHTVSGADYGSIAVDDVVVTVTDDEVESSEIALSVDPSVVGEDAGSTTMKVTATLNEAPRTDDTTITVSIGASNDSAASGSDYSPVAAFSLKIEDGHTSANTVFVLTPFADEDSEGDEQISVTGETGIDGLTVTGTTVTISELNNTPPVFNNALASTLSVAENFAEGVSIGPRYVAADVDGHELSYSLKGADAGNFAINSANGQLRTAAKLDHEAKPRHSFSVNASDGYGGATDYALVVNVTDVDERAGTPSAPTVVASPGTTTSLSVSWDEPDPNDGPDITGYRIQYRERANSAWNDHRHIGRDTRATITGLSVATVYQVRIRALNGETPSGWSGLGTGHTARASNAVPVFVDGLPATLTVAENIDAGIALGTAFVATDADEDPLTYSLVDADRDAFTIDSTSGQLSALTSLDYEARAAYTLTLRVSDGNGGIDTLTVTVNVSDVDEQVGVPDAPMVLANPGFNSSVEVIWRQPDVNGGPPILGYEVQYRKRTASTAAAANSAVPDWIAHQHLGTGTSSVISYLDVDTAYEVRVRALNGEIAGEWSEPGIGRTAARINSPPVFSEELPSLVRVDENTTTGANIGEPFVALDREGHKLTYVLKGSSRRHFAINEENGQLTTRGTLDYESRVRHTLTIRVDDGHGGADTLTLAVVVVDVAEQAPALSSPSVLATANSTTGLDIDWQTPERNGGPAVVGFEVQYRIGGEGQWLNHELTRTTDTGAKIEGLSADSQYQVRVRALNGEIPGDWSEPGTGRTGRAVNVAPVFASGVATTLTVLENTGTDSDIGGPFTATDADGDLLTYTLIGANRRTFTIDSDSGQLRTLAELNHEAVASYALTIQASDGVGGADTVDVTMIVADIAEAAAQPYAPLVLATADSTESLELRWRVPDVNGGPPIENYDLQYRASNSDDWIDIAHAGAATKSTLSGLQTATKYEARVRAINGELPSVWSESGIGTTGRVGNAAPRFSDETATRSVTEDSLEGEPVGAAIVATDPDRDSLTYTLNGEDSHSFDIDPQTGQIRTAVLLDYEAQSVHAVNVSAWDGNGGVATIDVSIEVIDAQEAESQLGPAKPIGVRLGRTLSLDATNTVQSEISLRWEHGDQDGSQAPSRFEFRLGRYPESSNGASAPAFQCAGNRPFETDGWRRIPDSGPAGTNARGYRFGAQTLGCYVLQDTFELRAQVRAVAESTDTTSTRYSAWSTEARMRDEAPRVAGLALESVDLASLASGEDLTFVVVFTEPVKVTTNGTSPTIEFTLGGTTRQAAFERAERPPVFRNYGSGTIGSELYFSYEVQSSDELTAGIAVPADAITITGGAAILDATGPLGHAANLTHSSKTLAEGSAVLASTSGETVKAEFETDAMPDVHDGETVFSVQVNFNKDQDDEPLAASDVSGLTLSATSVLITGGTIGTIARVEQSDDSRWRLTVEPNSNGDVSVSLGPTIDCDDDGAVCTTSGRRLSNNIHAVIKGPPGIRVTDAQVAEGTNATMDFVVTLSRALAENVSVTYATADGTAIAGEDYEETSGTLTFEAGATSQVVSVSVLDDAHDDDGESFTLTLSNPSGANAYVAQATATGTIRNADPMPKAWIVRFGRTVSSHVIDAIQTRLGDRERENHFKLGGYAIGDFAHGDRGMSQATTTMARVGDLRTPAWTPADDLHLGYASPRLASTAAFGNRSHQTSGIHTGSQSNHAMSPALGSGYAPFTLADILKRSSFFYRSGDGELDREDRDSVGFKDWSAWGNTTTTRFNGKDDSLTIEGEVFTAALGADASWDRWLTGVVLAHSYGEGAFTHDTAKGGATTSTLTTLNPYAQYRFSDRTSVWGTFGAGRGDLALTPTDATARIETDLEMMMAAFGGRGVLSIQQNERGQFELALRSDSMYSRTNSGVSANLLSATGVASRLRVVLEGAGAWTVTSNSVLMPTLEAGLRYDDGDAETGGGVELGAGLAWAMGRVKFAASARGLVAHEVSRYDEWGFTSSVAYSPGPHGRGLNLRFGSAWGAAQSSSHALWDRETARGLTNFGSMNTSQRFQAEMGYGLPGQHIGTLWRPFVGVESNPFGSDTLHAGFKYTMAEQSEIGLLLQNRTQPNGEPNIGLKFSLQVLW